MRVRRPRRVRIPRRKASEQFRRGIYLIPSLFTVGNMLCGFSSVLNALHGRFATAAWLLVLAGVLDGLDGRIARLTRSSSDFGKEYDSLADVVSFGAAPAVLVYLWGLSGMGRWGWAVAFLFLVAGSVRLARFNVQSQESGGSFFTGMPIPAGAGTLAVLVLLHPQPVDDPIGMPGVSAFVLLIALLMVTGLPYRSYKDLNLRQRWPATAFFLFAVIIAVIAVSPVPTMAFLAATYLLSGPVELLFRRLTRKRRAAPATSQEGPGAATSPAKPDHP